MSPRITQYFIFFFGVFSFIQCERPGSPDFKLSRTIEVPVYNERKIHLLGDGNALIDTTAKNFRDLFEVDEESFITLVNEKSFEFNNLDGAIPEFAFSPVELSARVGPILIGDFTSGDNTGSAGIQSLTGVNPAMIGEGDIIPGGTSPQPVNIPLNTDYFISATISDGGLNLVLENDLGFDIKHLTLELYSGAVFIQSVIFSDLVHHDSQEQSMEITPGTVLENLNIDLSIVWENQSMLDEPGELILKSLKGENLVASEVVAVIGQQEFNVKSTVDIDSSEFRFSTSEHFVELNSGALIISEIENDLDIDLELIEITFSDIRYPPFQEADSLVIRIEGNEKITRKSSDYNDLVVDLSGLRIYGKGNQINYNVYTITEDSRTDTGVEPIAINENDEVHATIEITEIGLERAFGIVGNRLFFLNSDSPVTGMDRIDLFDNNEAQSVELEGLRDFSGKLDGLEFTDASISINYQTNIGIPMTIFGAFVGITENGEMIYLSGIEGQPTYVNDLNKVQGLLADGIPLNADQLIRFTVDTNQEGLQSGSVIFNRENSNIVKFLNNIPSEIRFIGKADLNPDEVEGTLQMPIAFDPVIAMDIPLSVQTIEKAVYSEILDLDLSDLPDESDDLIIEEGKLSIQYKNNFPLQVSVNMDFLNEVGTLITTVPREGQQEIAFWAAEIGVSGFSTPEGHSGNMVVSFNKEQLRALNSTDRMNLSLGLRTFDQQEVKLRATDQVTLSMSAKFILESAVN